MSSDRILAHPTLQDALEIAKLAGAVAQERFRRQLDIQFKADESPVTEADLAIERIIRSELQRRFPQHGIVGEEYGAALQDGAAFWIIDPIDGTRSFLSGHPLFGLLLAFISKTDPEIGLVAMPALDEVFVAMTGQGAFLNGRAIHCSSAQELDTSILYINEGEKIWRHQPEVFHALMEAGQTRRLAYDCYSHALVALGQVDAVVDYGLAPYDYLPLAVLVREAGGVMTDWHGNPLSLDSDGRTLTAATPQLHARLLDLVREAR